MPGDILRLGAPTAKLNRRAEGWISRMVRDDGGGFTRADFATHVREEHSTFGWVLEGLIERTGFRIVAAEKPDPAHADYLCATESAA